MSCWYCDGLVQVRCSCRRDEKGHLPLRASGSRDAPADAPKARRCELFQSPPCGSCFLYLRRLSRLFDLPPEIMNLIY